MPGAQAPSGPPGRLVLVSGRHPFRRAGGHESFVAAHAATARRAGYDPHIFAVGNRSARVETPVGTLHVVGTPVRPIRSHTAILQRPWMVRAIAREIGDAPGPHVLHAFGAWVDTAVASSRLLERRGVQAVPIATAWVTIGHETIAKGGSGVVHASRLLALRHRLELAIALHSTRGVEARGYRACREVIVNYDSVRELLRVSRRVTNLINAMPETTVAHRRIYEALVAHEPETARQAMRSHLLTVTEVWTKPVALRRDGHLPRRAGQ